MTDNEPEFLTGAQVARRLGVSRRTVPDLMNRMGVTRYDFGARVVRYNAAELDMAIKAAATRK